MAASRQCSDTGCLQVREKTYHRKKMTHLCFGLVLPFSKVSLLNIDES